MYGVTKQRNSYGDYLFLNVVKGTSEIIDIHNCFYISIFGQENSLPYIPHMTIGNLASKSEMDHAYLEIKNMDAYFETLVTKISVEMIGERNESIIMIEKNLE